MRDYVIITDSSCDLDAQFREPYGIRAVKMHYYLDDVAYDSDLDWKAISPEEFYGAMRNGAKVRSAQVNVEEYKAAFKEILDEGCDVLSISCSSNISASVKASYMARDELKAEYPDAKIICVDGLRACHALGILVMTAGEMKAAGKSIEEVAEWLEENKLTSNMVGSVDKLTYLKNAGRVSATSAFFGGLLNIKPIIIADALGRNFACEKVKGRNASLLRTAEIVKENYLDVPHQKVFISHADCLEDAETLKKMIWEQLGKEIPIYIGYVGTSVGTAVGPGMIGVHYFGKEVTVNKE